jgi:hypothetical protein
MRNITNSTHVTQSARWPCLLQEAPQSPYVGFTVEAGEISRSVVVQSVDPRANASGKLFPGDLILSVNRRSIASVEKFNDLIKSVQVGSKLTVRFRRKRSDAKRPSSEILTEDIEVSSIPRPMRGPPVGQPRDGGIEGFERVSPALSSLVVVGPIELESGNMAEIGEPNLNFFIRFEVRDGVVNRPTLHFNWRGPPSIDVTAARICSDEGAVVWSLQDFEIDKQIRTSFAPYQNLGNGQSFKTGADEITGAMYCSRNLTISDVEKLKQVVQLQGPLHLEFEGNNTAQKRFSDGVVPGIRKALQLIEDKKILVRNNEENAPPKQRSMPVGQDGKQIEWASKWRIIGEDGSTASFFLLKADGSATKSHAPNATGRWQSHKAGVLIEWSDGWKDILVPDTSGISKRAFGPERSIDDEPTNTQTAVMHSAIR